MRTQNLLNNIESIIISISNDQAKLTKVLSFLEYQILDENNDKDVILNKYMNAIPKITEIINSGFICYFNPETNEFEQVDEDAIFYLEAYEVKKAKLFEFFDEDYLILENYIKFEPLNSLDKYEIIKSFIYKLKDHEFAARLLNLLNSKKSLLTTKKVVEIIKNSNHNKEWDIYRRRAIEESVKKNLYEGIKLEKDTIS